MLKALGIGKNRRASSDTIHNLKEQEDLRDQWKKAVNDAKLIINVLDRNYQLHKGEFPPIRYGHLKDVIKDANNKASLWKEETQSIEADRQRKKYNSEHEDNSVRNKGLLQEAESYLQAIEEFSDEEKYKEEHKELSDKEAEDQIKSFHHEVLKYKEEYRKLRDSLAELKLNYENSKAFFPLRRYSQLKRMTKDVTGQLLPIDTV